MCLNFNDLFSEEEKYQVERDAQADDRKKFWGMVTNEFANNMTGAQPELPATSKRSAKACF